MINPDHRNQNTSQELWALPSLLNIALLGMDPNLKSNELELSSVLSFLDIVEAVGREVKKLQQMKWSEIKSNNINLF